jgi:DNA-binding NarL/FixJ family response regulator
MQVRAIACAGTGPQARRMAFRVVIADDSYLTREAVAHVLAGVDDIDVVAVCDDRDSLLAAISRERPDVVVTDIRMPPNDDAEGILIAGLLRASHPNIGVVVLSQYLEPAYALDLFAGGSDGRAYLLKERIHDRDEIVDAIRAVAEGGSVIDPKVVEMLVAVRARAQSSPLGGLTRRERQILSEIARGKSNLAIAESLGLSKRAVEKHINAIFTKLELAESDDVSRRVKATLLFLADESESGARDTASSR